jgi:hypothetical protein
VASGFPAAPAQQPAAPQQPQFQPQFQPQQPGQQPQQFQSPSGGVSQSPLRDSLAQRGLDVSGFDSDDAILQTFQAGYQQLQQLPQLQQLAQYGQRYLPHVAEFEQFLAQRQQQQPQQQPASKFAPPEYDSKYDQFMEMDPRTGRYRSMVPELAGYAEQKNRYEEWRRETADRMLRKPDEFFWEVSQERIQKEISTRVQEILDARHAQEQINHYFTENAGEFFLLDQSGQPQRDFYGNEVMTPKGQAFVHFATQARELGITNPLRVQQYAAQQVASHFGGQAVPPQQQPAQPGQQVQQITQQPRSPNGQFAPVSPAAPPLTPQQRNETQKQTFLQGATRNRLNGNGHSPSPSQTVAAALNPSGPPQNGSLEFHEIAQQVMREQGVLPQTG